MPWVSLDRKDLCADTFDPKNPLITEAGSQKGEALSVSLSLCLVVFSLEYVNVLPSKKTSGFRSQT